MAVIITVLIAAVFLGSSATGWLRYKKRRMRASFGPELKTVALEHEGVREVDRELRRRTNLYSDLSLHAIGTQDREFYATSWENLQGEFVDSPSLALATAERLVAAVLDARGYPGGDEKEQFALLSVKHSPSLAGFRAAQQTSRRAAQDSAATPTEELRRAMLAYHALFTELLGDPDAAIPMAVGNTGTAPDHHDQEANT
jgi:hypothetical protein